MGRTIGYIPPVKPQKEKSAEGKAQAKKPEKKASAPEKAGQ